MEHTKLMLVEREGLGSVCQCECGYIHFSYGPVMLTLSPSEFAGITELLMTATKRLKHDYQNDPDFGIALESPRTQ
jgi:hypothetical protein